MLMRLKSLSLAILLMLLVSMPIVSGGCSQIASYFLYNWMDDNFGNNADKDAPVIQQVSADHQDIKVNENVLLEVTATDDKDSAGDLTYFWFASAGVLTSPTSRITAWKAPTKAGKVTITIMVEDTDGNQDSQSVELTIGVAT
jgi:hypothetical protein